MDYPGRREQQVAAAAGAGIAPRRAGHGASGPTANGSANAASASASTWQAQLDLCFEAGQSRTELVRRAHVGPLVVQRPFYPEGACCHLYLLHPPGGVAACDQLRVTVECGSGAQVLLTAPGAMKFYRSEGVVARVEQHFDVASGACLEWLPPENIWFRGARATLTTRIHLQSGARLAYQDVQCFGRPAANELFSAGEAEVGLVLERDGEPLLHERLRVNEAALAAPSILAGMAATGTLILAPGDPALVEACREAGRGIADVRFGVTQVDDLCVVRALAASAEPLRRLFTALWMQARPAFAGRAACAPRIWAT